MASISPWLNVEAVLVRHLYKPDLQAARCLYAAVAAHRLAGQLVWPMVVAPPGSAKTFLVESLDDLPGMNVHLIDSVTPRTFISGQLPDPARPSKKPASLLLRIGDKGIIVASDFSTILSGNPENRKAIFADLRKIYDGHLDKEYGTASDDPHEWSGRLTFVTAVTGAIDDYTAVFQALGERFLLIRWPRASGIEAGIAAMQQDTQRAKTELHNAIVDLYGAMPGLEPDVPQASRRRLAALGEFAALARTHVPRSPYGQKEIIAVPEAESATRLPQQFGQLVKGSALLEGRATVTSDDVELAQRVAFDCIAPTRRKLLDAFLAGQNLATLKMPPSTMTYAKGDLEALGLMEDSRLSPTACELLREAGINVPLASQAKRVIITPAPAAA